MKDEIDVKQVVASARGAVLAAIQRDPRHRFSKRGRTVAAAVGGIALVAALSGAAFAVAQASQDDISFSVACYEGPSLSSRMTTVAAAEGVDNSTGESSPRDLLDPLEACGEMWRMGILGQDKPTSAANDADYPVPELVRCTLSDGIAAVFPWADGLGEDASFCDSLGLQP